MAFIVVAPTFQTLRQQTLERIVKAGLANGTSEDVVNPYSWASKARLAHVSPHQPVTSFTIDLLHVHALAAAVHC